MTNQYRVFVFGEVLWDMLPTGKKLGGAPANFAYHVRLLGGDAVVCSKVGPDELGAEIKSRFTAAGLPMNFLQTDSVSPTGTVQVHLSASGQPSYEIVENVAWDHIETQDSAIHWISGADAVYFGSLALRDKANRHTLDRILAAAPEKAMKVFDLNLRAPFYSQSLIEAMLEQTNVFKFNDDELVILVNMFRDRLMPFTLDNNGSIFKATSDGRLTLLPEVNDWLVAFSQLAHLDTMILTCGARGSCLFSASGEISCLPAGKVERIADTVGAGDAFTAVCVHGLVKHKPISLINEAANQYAAYICSQSGAMPEVPSSLTGLLE